MILVAVAILVGVFFVATGRGGELAYEQADHAPLDLGPVSATDVALLRPPTALWGYNMQVTDEALEQIAQAIRDRDVTIAFLQQRLTDLTARPVDPGEQAGPEPPAGPTGPGRSRRRGAGRRRARRRGAELVTGPDPAPDRTGGPVPGPDGKLRCPWGLSAPEYLAYHDQEWGRPVRGDTKIFERLCLEGFQSGLSWLTILRKRENFRAAFAGFDLAAVAAFGDADVARLLADAGIVRNRAKINAVLVNARAALGLPDGLSALVWKYAGEPAAAPRTLADCPPPPRSPRRSAPNSSATASPSPARSPRTPPCRPAASSTTTWPAASPASGRSASHGSAGHGGRHPVRDLGQQRAARADRDPDEPVARRAEVQPPTWLPTSGCWTR